MASEEGSEAAKGHSEDEGVAREGKTCEGEGWNARAEDVGDLGGGAEAGIK